MSKLSQILEFVIERKQWAIAPVLVVFLLLSLVIVAAQSSAVAPFIYTLF